MLLLLILTPAGCCLPDFCLGFCVRTEPDVGLQQLMTCHLVLAGYFPVKLECLPEGTCIHPHVPVYQV